MGKRRTPLADMAPAGTVSVDRAQSELAAAVAAAEARRQALCITAVWRALDATGVHSVTRERFSGFLRAELNAALAEAAP